MKKLAQRCWREDSGVLSFEWVLLMSILSIGVVSGIAGARDAIVDEFADVAQSITALDQSYTIDFPLAVHVNGRSSTSSSDSAFTDCAHFYEGDRDYGRLLPGGNNGPGVSNGFPSSGDLDFGF